MPQRRWALKRKDKFYWNVREYRAMRKRRPLPVFDSTESSHAALFLICRVQGTWCSGPSQPRPLWAANTLCTRASRPWRLGPLRWRPSPRTPPAGLVHPSEGRVRAPSSTRPCSCRGQREHVAASASLGWRFPALALPERPLELQKRFRNLPWRACC